MAIKNLIEETLCPIYSNKNTPGISGNTFDCWVQKSNLHDDSAIIKMQHQFWVTKQALSRKLGKKEDECIIASDAELDAKLELFRSIQESCSYLQRVIDRYQERLCSTLINNNVNFVYVSSIIFFKINLINA